MEQLMRFSMIWSGFLWLWFSSVLCLVDMEINGTAQEGKRWAVLVAGSRDYDNYRHQADVCHAYQVLKKGGLEGDNIIVFMYDDIAFNKENPRPGIVINKPYGDDVYNGVPKDYTGENVNSDNLYAVILGNKTGVTGGSGKVVDSGPNDRIFIFYADHGSSGSLGMPTDDDIVANDFINVLKKKHHSNGYKSMVIYIEACESGSMFQGLLPKDMNIYAVTASNAEESSWGTYCPGGHPPSPDLWDPSSQYDTCLGDLFSISWMEDSDVHNLRNETLDQQYKVVRRRTAVDTLHSSHVMQYGNLKLQTDLVFSYLGTNPANDNVLFSDSQPLSLSTSSLVSQRDATLLHLRRKFEKSVQGSQEKIEAENKLKAEVAHRSHIDTSINHMIKLVFGDKLYANSTQFRLMARDDDDDQPLVQDWNCFKELVKTYKKYCGSSTSRYEMKYTRVFANMCNQGIKVDKALSTITQVCTMAPQVS